MLDLTIGTNPLLVSSLAWPDRYFFYRAFIACSISARRKKRVWSCSITQVVLDTSEPTGGVDFFGSLCIGIKMRL